VKFGKAKSFNIEEKKMMKQGKDQGIGKKPSETHYT
jgi:hypothetical protein